MLELLEEKGNSGVEQETFRILSKPNPTCPFGELEDLDCDMRQLICQWISDNDHNFQELIR